MKNYLPAFTRNAFTAARLLLPALLLLIFADTTVAQVKKKNTVLKAGADDAPAMYIKPDGNVGIGVADPTNKLEMGGNLHMMGNRIYFYNEAGNQSSFMQWNFTDAYNGANDNKLALAGFHGFKILDVSHGTVPILQAGFDVTPGVVDIRSAERNGTHPAAAQLSLYVTGQMDKDHGVEFRTSDGKKGLGFDFESIYTAGTELQDIRLDAKGDKNLRFHTNEKERLRIDGSGNIWTNGNGIYFRGGFGDSNQFIKWRPMENDADGDVTHDRLLIGGWNGVEIGSPRYFGRAVTINPLGFIGIGTNQPQFPLHLAFNRESSDQAGITGNEYSSGGAGGSQGRKFKDVSIYSTGHIVTRAVLIAANNGTYSDIRLKKDVKASSSVIDLQILRQIAVVDYKMIDTLNDAMQYKKVIAQQVQKVYPNAIGTTFNTLPDIYQYAQSVTQQGDSLYNISVAKAVNIKTGDIIVLKCPRSNEVNVTVTHVDNGSNFTVKSATVLTGQKGVFVYGHPADDVLTVDYDAISMLNVSATQQLANTIDEQQKEIALLKAQNSAITLENKILKNEQAATKTAVTDILMRLARVEAKPLVTTVARVK